MAPAMPEDPIGEETYVVIERAGSPQPLSRPGPRAAAPKWSALVDAWLTSEFVNGNDYVRFAPGVPLRRRELAAWLDFSSPHGRGAQSHPHGRSLFRPACKVRGSSPVAL
jgi:hypothetical protein